MKSYNLIYKNNQELEQFIKNNNIESSNNILIQVFSGIIDENIVLDISKKIKEYLPNSNIIGTTTAGEILDAKMYEKSIIISFLCFDSTVVKTELFDFENKFEISDISSLISDNTKALIILSDGLKSNAQYLLDEISKLKPDLIIAGGRAGDFLEAKKTFIFNNNAFTQNGCIIASLSSDDLIVNNDYMLNWNTIGKKMIVTKSKNNQLFELDGIPIVDIYKKYLGEDIMEGFPMSSVEFPLLIKKTDVDIARGPIALLDDNSVLFGGNIDEGDVVQFSFGNIENVKRSAFDNFNKFKNYSSEAILIYSCSARKTLMNKELENEFQVLNSIAPTVGFFTYGEYFHSQNTNEILNVSTTFMTLSENKKVVDKDFKKYEILPENRIVNILTHLTQVTSQELEDSIASKSRFLANMSHEIRTPLNAILGFIDLLKEETKGSRSEKYVDIIDNSSKSLLQIIEDILDFSKIENEKLEIDNVDFNSKAEFEIMTYLFNATCSSKNISLILNIDENLPKTLNSDPFRIKQIISNLLSNAIKFSKNGSKIIVDINYNNNFLNISVKDEGVGISKDKLLHIFGAFNQEDSSTTREYGGTGLGLSISSELVKLLGGKLKVKSELNIGSEFYFSIPVKIGKEIEVKIPNKKTINFENRKILIVEDNKANQMFMKVILKKMNISFDIRADGIEAIDAFKNNKYDVIFMDENMPNMNGIEATKQILEFEKQNNITHTPIVALTANALKGDKERFLSAGMDEYMTKPLDKIKLIEILNNLLND